MDARTIDGKVAESGARGALNLAVVAGEKVEHGVEGVAPNFAHILFRDLRKREGSRALQVDVVGERKGREGRKG